MPGRVRRLLPNCRRRSGWRRSTPARVRRSPRWGSRVLSMLRPLTVGLAIWCVMPSTAAFEAAAARTVVWTIAGEAALERDLNTQAARGLRVAAVSDGLPCTVTALQTPDPVGPPAAYRVVADRDLVARLPQLGEDGFVPRFAHRRTGGRAHVIFERLGGEGATLSWRLIEFPELDALPPAIAAAAADGFRARLLVRYPLRSWPGSSERGLILASKPASGRSREAQVVVGQSRNLDAAVKAVTDATGKGFSFDLLFTGSRDGSPQTRRERMVVLLSKESGATAAAPPVALERTTSFGTFGN